jgi:hypothetical protein
LKYLPVGLCLALALFLPRSSAAATIFVPAGGSLQAAIDAAKPGDVIELQAGATFDGPFKLRAKAGMSATSRITIRTAGSVGLPAAGVRITPAASPFLAKVRATLAGPAIKTDSGAAYWTVMRLEVLPNASSATASLVDFGSGGTSQNTLATVPHHLVLDRVYLHDDPAYAQRRGVALNSGDAQIVNSHFAKFSNPNNETQAIGGWNGPGPYLIENNYLEAASENIMFGGEDPHILNLIPTGITIRRNRIVKPTSWMKTVHVKNLIELKNAASVVIDANTLEQVWLDGQQGYALMFSPRNQSGTAPWSQVRDVVVKNNVIRHVGAGVNITGYDDLHTSGQTQDITITNNLFYDVTAAWTATTTLAPGRGIYIGAGPKDIAITKNTFVTASSALLIGGGKSPTGVQITGFVFNDNLVHAGKYPIYGNAQGEGTKGLTYYTPGFEFQGNVIGKTSTAAYPPGADMVDMATLERQFVDFAHDVYCLTANATILPTAGVDFAAMNNPAAGCVAPPSSSPAPTTGSTPYAGTAVTLPGTAQFENYDAGGEAVAYKDTTSGNSGGVYRSNNVDIQATTDVGAGYNLGYVKATEWLNYTVDVKTAGTYAIDVRVASKGAGGTVHIEVDGVDKTGPIAVPDTGGWQVWKTLTKTGVTLAAGQHVVRVVMDTNGASGYVGNLNWWAVR